MKGAIGNAFILNVVITFIIIFFILLIGSMAYSKAYKVKNYLINLIDQFEIENKSDFNAPISKDKKEWDEISNAYLAKVGYHIATQNGGCKEKEGYISWKTSKTGEYDYCIYRNYHIVDADNDPIVYKKYNYMVRVYMKLDLPVIGDYVKIPITGETKTYSKYR